MSTVSFSGIASGIDSDSIISATLEANRLREVPLKNTITANDDESSALEELNTKLLALSDSLKEMTTAYGGAVSKKAVSGDEDYITASASRNAPTTSTKMTVLQLAQAATLSFNDRFSSTADAVCSSLTSPQTLEFTLGQGDSAQKISVEITSTSTLNELAESINTAGEGYLNASLVNVGTASSPSYALVVSGTNTGLEEGSLSVSVPSELSSAGVLSNYSLEQATDAKVELSGVGTVSRSSNQISDLIPGVTLELKKVSSTPINLSVVSDSSDTASKMSDIVSQINDIITYISDNDTITRETDDDGNVTNTYGSLAKGDLDNDLIRAIQSTISDSHSSSNSSAVQVLADLGITINHKDGTYEFDEEKFLAGLKDDSTSSENLLQSFVDKLGSTTGVIYGYTKYDGTIQKAIDANDEQNETLTDRIAAMEEMFAKESERLKAQFTALETLTAKLNSEQSSLSSILSSSSSS